MFQLKIHDNSQLLLLIMFFFRFLYLTVAKIFIISKFVSKMYKFVLNDVEVNPTFLDLNLYICNLILFKMLNKPPSVVLD